LHAAEARELVAMAASRRRLFTVFHNRRWDSDFLTLKSLIDRNELGRIVSLESRFDRYRPLVRDRWRERAEPGSGTWFDLGPHLVDQALVLFGMPAAVSGYLDCQRDGAVTTDCFQVMLRYPRLSVLLASSYLAAAPAPRFRVFGVNGSYVKAGVDPQEAALALGETPTAATSWGADPVQGIIASATTDGVHDRVVENIPGNYPAFYGAVREAVRSATPSPVSGTDVIAGIAILEAAIASSRTRREIPVTQS
jgi:predicted dehydrogenase